MIWCSCNRCTRPGKEVKPLCLPIGWDAVRCEGNGLKSLDLPSLHLVTRRGLNPGMTNRVKLFASEYFGFRVITPELYRPRHGLTYPT